MKITFTIIFLAFILSLKAQSYIRVSNNPGAIADYSNLQTAIYNAPVGSTIFVEPSTTSYGDIIINRRLVLLGGGYDQTKHNNKKTQIGTVNFNKQNSNPNRTILSGFYISGGITSNGVDSISVQRCLIASINNAVINLNSTLPDSTVGWRIINCKLTGTYPIFSSYTKNILISNNIISTTLSFFDQYSIFVTNNVFQSSQGTNVSNVSYSNNVFYNGIQNSCSNCTFTNNLTAQSASSLNYADNISSNNIEGVATNNIFVSYTIDYHLKSTCPGVNAGSDGKDIGIYGGLFPFPDVDYGITGYPEINSLSISNPVVEPSGTLKINVKSKIIH